MLAKPGSGRDSLRWDPWRSRWVIQVREPPVDGKANAAILRLLARSLRVEEGRVQWIIAGPGREKLAAVEGLTDAEARQRLSEAAAGAQPVSER